MRITSEHMERMVHIVAGDWALNHNGQLVAAWDKPRVFKGATYTYYCVCGCGDVVTLRRGNILRAHFAYKAHRRHGCTGTEGCKETEIHYNAKWLLCDIFQQINFWRVCWCDHRISKNQYTGPEWTATVEKKIPGTKRIADVLLENSSTKEAVALEVYHTHAVKKDKKDECELAGVTIIEVEAAKVTPDCRDLNNELSQYEHDECGECIFHARVELERFEAYRARKEKEENEEYELSVWIREQECAREEIRAIERVEQERVREEIRAIERVEQERVREEIRARERAKAETERDRLSQRIFNRQIKHRTFLKEMEALDRLLLCAYTKLNAAEIIQRGGTHMFTSAQQAQQLEEYTACKGVVTRCEDSLELHKDSGRGRRSRPSRAAAGCIACADGVFRCTVHDDRDTEIWK
jgi:hypothetical protein